MLTYTQIIDISQPVSTKTACFPGDVPFSRNITETYKNSGFMNLSAFTMSPHVGTHADAPVHIHGEYDGAEKTIGVMDLSPFIGPVQAIDVSDWRCAIEPSQFNTEIVCERVLFKTLKNPRYDLFEEEYAHFSVALVEALTAKGVKLMGLDTPSVDHIHSKNLEAHHAMLKANMSWLENLDLSQVDAGQYTLIALPLKLTELEASPVRAVLLA